MSTVQLKNIIKTFDNIEVLHNINLKIEEAEFVVLVGPSGCGKSTTLRLIAGLEDVTDGEVIIDGKVVNMIEPNHRNIAMVFQNYALYPHMSVYKNMAYGLKNRGQPKDQIDAIANVILDDEAEVLEDGTGNMRYLVVDRKLAGTAAAFDGGRNHLVRPAFLFCQV